MNKEYSYKWKDYLICLCPLALIIYVSNETYAIDFRAFYLAGKSYLWGLNPYINHINIDPDFYGPINSELAYYSGWKYPPLATYIFAPFALIKYEVAKNLFNLLSLIVLSITLAASIKLSKFKIAPESILIVAFSFPILSTISRGQIEIFLVSLAVASTYLFYTKQIMLSTVIVSILASIKIFPFVLIIAYLKKKKYNPLYYFSITLVLILGITLWLCPAEWLSSFANRALIPWDEVPGKVMDTLPGNSGVIDGTMTVRSSDARNLLHSHYFVFGFGNPLLSKNLLLASIIGIIGAFSCLIKYRKASIFLISFSIMNWINIINPISWIMGLCWYVPLFLFSYTKTKDKYKYLISLPLILPPFLNASAYLAAIISLFITKLYKPNVNH